jgi:hypothetical protein
MYMLVRMDYMGILFRSNVYIVRVLEGMADERYV